MYHRFLHCVDDHTITKAETIRLKIEVHQWTYDSIGNRLTNTVNSTTKNYTYFKNGANPNNGQRLANDGVTAYSYNPPGGSSIGGWNVAMQMTSTVGTTNTYKYDYIGRRSSKKIVNSTTEYIYDGQNLIGERGAAIADFVFGPGIDEPLAVLRGGAIYYYNADGLGSIGGVNNTTGTLQNTYAYDAWGVLRSQTGTLANPFGYTSREFGENGLLYYRARYYKPDHGRFISEDPVRFLAGQNFYLYVRNRPIALADPTGLKPPIVCPPGVKCNPYNPFIVPPESLPPASPCYQQAGGVFVKCGAVWLGVIEIAVSAGALGCAFTGPYFLECMANIIVPLEGPAVVGLMTCAYFAYEEYERCSSCP